jgi:hypothetical protein
VQALMPLLHPPLPLKRLQLFVLCLLCRPPNPLAAALFWVAFW